MASLLLPASSDGVHFWQDAWDGRANRACADGVPIDHLPPMGTHPFRHPGMATADGDNRCHTTSPALA